MSQPVAGDDVRLPLVRIDGRAGEPLQRGEATEMRAVGMCQGDVPEVARRAADPPDVVEDDVGVRVEQGVDQRELTVTLEQVGVDSPALALPEAVDAGCDLDVRTLRL